MTDPFEGPYVWAAFKRPKEQAMPPDPSWPTWAAPLIEHKGLWVAIPLILLIALPAIVIYPIGRLLAWW